MVGLNERRLDLGQRQVSHGVMAELAGLTPLDAMTLVVFQALHRMERCDWGDVSDHDKNANDADLERGEGRILGVYTLALPDGGEIRVYGVHYQKADGGPSTTIILPCEY